MTHVYGWLAEQSSEDALHAERLLFIEERPFQRITRRLLAEDSILRPKQLLSPPPEAADGEVDDQKDTTDEAFLRQKFREDVLVDFAALESSIMRIQLIQSSNERERERYASEKAKILATSQAVRENTTQLREQLTEAQRILELRKGYDTLAAKILDDRKLKSRDETRADIATLEKDIAELEAESKDADEVWEARRQGFEQYVQHGKAYLRAIKGIKDQPEAEEDDRMDEGDEAKHDSTAGTPRPDGMSTPQMELGGTTPVPETADGDNDQDTYQHSKLRTSDLAESNPTEANAKADSSMTDAPAATDLDEARGPTTDEAVNDDIAEEVMDET